MIEYTKIGDTFLFAFTQTQAVLLVLGVAAFFLALAWLVNRPQPKPSAALWSAPSAPRRRPGRRAAR